jgi:hypothetical protein
MLEFAKKYESNVHSQNGEDGIIAEVIRRIGLLAGVSVEFGAPDRFYCSNTAALPESWVKRFYSDQSSDGVEEKFITPQNVNELPSCTILSIDIDGNDFNVWEAYNGQPDIVVIEINSSCPPGDVIKSSPTHGTTYTPMVHLGLSKGYFLLCHTGNLVFVDKKYRKLFPEIIGDGLSNSDKYFNTAWLER